MPDGPHRAFFRGVLDVLRESDIRFLVGGAFALTFYSGIHRDTKDLDLFLHPRDSERVVDLFSRMGYSADMVAPHWLGKVKAQEGVVDLIFGSRNGIATVDDAWFTYAVDATTLDVPVKMVSVEEMIWSKGFVMERGRYDGADIAHLLRSKGRSVDWHRLLARFGDNWSVLFSHLLLFAFVYPSEQSVVPDWLKQELASRWQQLKDLDPVEEPLCRGTLLSQAEYAIDIEQWGYLDARVAPLGNLALTEIDR